MIRIDKPADGPPILTKPTSRGPKKTKELCDAFDNGQQDFEFASDVYGAKSVKNKLIKAQHEKCCFCESKVTHVAYGDVEHFRPKAGYRQEADDPLAKPGYYWLAYDWNNLLFSCQLCNQRYKKNLFPLANPDERALSHHDEGKLANEEPLFINPAVDDPGDFIGFRQEYPYAIDDHPRGKTTIKALGLDREELAEMRRTHLEVVKMAVETVATFQARSDTGDDPLSDEEERLLAEWRAWLDGATQDSAPYAAMVRAGAS